MVELSHHQPEVVPKLDAAIGLVLTISLDLTHVLRDVYVVASLLDSEVGSSFKEVWLNGKQNLELNEMGNDSFCGILVDKSKQIGNLD